MIVTVIGLGVFGEKIVNSLSDLDVEVIAVDKVESKIDKVRNSVHDGVIVDSTNEDALRAAGIGESDLVIVAIGDETEQNTLTVLALKQLGIQRIIARSINPYHKKVLTGLGLTQIISIEEEAGASLALSIAFPNILNLKNFPAGYSIVEIKPIRDWIGKSVLNLRLRQIYKLTILCIQRKFKTLTEEGKNKWETNLNACPDPGFVIEEEDIITLSGETKVVQEFLDFLKRKYMDEGEYV